jgi:GGDEF domain-containing protein
VEPVDRRNVVDRILATPPSGKAGSGEFRLRSATGERRWTRWWWHPGTGTGMIVCIVDVDDDHVREANLWLRATHDPLTGLVNRTQLLDLTERALHHRDLASARPAIVFADLDVLRTAAERMSSAIRPDDVLARVGGDEFAVLCHDIADDAEAEAVAKRLRDAVDLTISVNGDVCDVSVTTGIALANVGDTAETLLARADEAMYAEKLPSARRVTTLPAVDEKLAEADVDRALSEASEALAQIERLLTGTWRAVAGTPHIDRATKDRLVQAARLATAAARALDPRSVQ